MKQTFENYLEEVHAKLYTGTDDDMLDQCNDWVANLDIQEVIDYAEQWGAEQYEAGHITGELKERKSHELL